MSIGNLKTDGGKGTNWPWQYRMLKGLEGIINAINTSAEAQEYEAKVVNINCPGDPGDPFTGDRIYLEVRVFNTDSGLFEPPVYYLPGEDVAFPVTDFDNCTITYAESEVPYTLGQKAMNESVPVVIANDQEGIAVTPALSRVIISGTVAVGSRSVSIANVGSEDGLVLGTVLSAGETITFDAGSINNTLGAILYDPTSDGVGVTATTFLIATLT